MHAPELRDVLLISNLFGARSIDLCSSAPSLLHHLLQILGNVDNEMPGILLILGYMYGGGARLNFEKVFVNPTLLNYPQTFCKSMLMILGQGSEVVSISSSLLTL